MNATQTALDRVTRVPGVRGALVVAATDGLVVAEQLMDGVDGQAAAALTGSLVGRLAAHGRERGSSAARLRPSPRRGGVGAGGARPRRPGARRRRRHRTRTWAWLGWR